MLLELFLLALATTLAGVRSEDYLDALYPTVTTFEEYDYIIVGAGSSGSVVASRLSEDENVKVLLLEAGGAPQLMTEVPYLFSELGADNLTEWKFYTEPQQIICQDQDNKKCLCNRYKGLGGCSSHNAMVYTRGARKDFDDFAKNGAQGWSWEDVLKVFKKIEDVRIPELRTTGYYGTEGMQTVSHSAYKTGLYEAYLEVGKQLGLEYVDYNTGLQTGYSDLQLVIRDGRRCSTEKAFLRPAVHRGNLHILTGAHVIKVGVDENKRARNVVYERGNETLTVNATKEIILSAGAIGTPQLLLLSGIGPRKDLQELGIDIIADLPVGKNLHDSVYFTGFAWYLNESVATPINYESLVNFFEGKGPLTSPGGQEIVFFINTKYANASENWPDVQLTPSVFPHGKDRDVTSISVILNHPQTQGEVKLRSKNPHDPPVIDLQYLSDEDDMLRMVEGIKFTREFMKTPAMQKFDPQLNPDGFSSCNHLDWESDKFVQCLLQYLVVPAGHFSCTNRMGDPLDPSTVLDPELRVKGIQGLRVADASVLPSITSGGMNAVCIMIGQKAADMIHPRPEKVSQQCQPLSQQEIPLDTCS